MNRPLIYGRIDNKNTFRIVNYLGKDINEMNRVRANPKGIICTTMSKSTLYEILVHVDYEQPQHIASIEVPDNEKQIERYLLSQGMKPEAIERFAQVTDFIDGNEVVIGQDDDLQQERMIRAYRWTKYGELNNGFTRRNINECLQRHLLEGNQVVIN